MLAIPSHHFDDFPLEPALSDYVKSTFVNIGGSLVSGKASLSDVDHDVQAFVQLRHQVISMNESTYSEEILGKYTAQMKNVVARIQTDEKSSVGPKASQALKFTWHDAYKPSVKITNSNLMFDWVNVLWNIGALLSRLAAQSNRSSDEGIKTANKFFQQSAGVFDLIHSILNSNRGKLLFTSVPGNNGSILPCLSNESLNFVKQLLLSQAQLCFYEKAVRDKKINGTMKSSIIAKLAAQSSNLFKAAFAAGKVGAITVILDPSWCNHVEYQSTLCAAAAEYWQSQACKDVALTEARGFGEEITRLARAEALLHQTIAVVSRNKLAATFADSANGFLRTVTDAKHSAENDNRTVYMESIPPASSLSDVAGLLMVKPLPVFDYNASLIASGLPPDPPLFKDIFPREVRDVKASADERMQQLLSQSTAEVNDFSNEARAVLSSVGLPGSLESYKSGGDLPDSLWEKIQRIQSLGSMSSIQSKLTELHSTSQRVLVTLGSIDECLKREESQDSLFRSKHSKYDSITTIAPSKTLQSGYRDDIGRCKAVFDQAREADYVVLRDIVGNEGSEVQDGSRLLAMIVNGSLPLNDYNIYDSILLAKSKTQLLALAMKSINEGSKVSETVADLLDMDHPQVSDNSGELTSIIESLELKLVDLSRLIVTRDQYLSDLTAAVDRSSVAVPYKLFERFSSPSYSSRSELISVVDEAMVELTELKTSISTSRHQQDVLLKEVLAINQSFAHAVSSDRKTVDRHLSIGKIEEAIAKFYNWHSKLSAGVTFYINLQARVSMLLQNCDDLAYTQQLRRQEYEMSLFQSYERNNQEALDRDLALKLANEMNSTPVPSPQNNLAPPPYSPSPYSSAPVYNNIDYINQPRASAPGYLPPISYAPQPAVAHDQYALTTGQGYQHLPPQQPYNPSQFGISQSYQPTIVGHSPSAQPYIQGTNYVPQLPSQPSYGFQNPASMSMAQTQPAPAPPAVAPLPTDHESKVRRIMEIGFARHVVEHYLKANTDNEEAAVNAILSASDEAIKSIPSSAPKDKSTSLLGKVWGRK